MVDHKTDELVLEKGKSVKVAHLEKPTTACWRGCASKTTTIQQRFTRLVNMAAMEEAKLIAFRDSQIDTLRKGDELPPGVIKLVKVFVATKRRMSVGDKMAGRHGNKGVVAKIMPDGRHAVPAGRHAGPDRAEPAGRAVAHERGPDPGDASGLGGQGARA